MFRKSLRVCDLIIMNNNKLLRKLYYQNLGALVHIATLNL